MTYTLDANDIIIDIQLGSEQEWLAQIPREQVIGTPLLSHVSGVATAAFIKGVLDSARRGHRVTVPYRCDTAQRRRSWLMDVALKNENLVSVSHQLIEDVPFRSGLTFRTATAHFVNAVPRCSVCNRVFTDAAWRDPDEQRPEGIWHTSIMDVVYEVCASCDALMRPLLNC